MKFCSKMLLVIAALVLLHPFGAPACAADAAPAARHGVRISFPGGEAVAVLLDTPLAGEFLRLLPLEAEFSDFSGEEKIFYLPEKLSARGNPTADEQKGDFCYYAPWGNIAVFYKGHGHGKNLYVLGNIVSGKEQLAAQRENFKARLEAFVPAGADD